MPSDGTVTVPVGNQAGTRQQVELDTVQFQELDLVGSSHRFYVGALYAYTIAIWSHVCCRNQYDSVGQPFSWDVA